jgi:hypothetical protein
MVWGFVRTICWCWVGVSQIKLAARMVLAKLPIMQMIANAILGDMQGRHQLGADKAYEKQYEKLFIYFHCPMRWSDHSDCVKGA